MNGLFVLVFSLIVSISFSTSAIASSGNLNIFPPGSEPYGLTHAEHAENFWKWILSIPAKDNPLNDPTGDICANGQSDSNSSVFILATNNGGKSVRTCEVPAGKGLLIPVMQVAYTEKEDPGSTIEDLHRGATKDQDSVNSLYLRLDDKEYNYEDLIKYRVHTDDFDVVFADNGPYGVVEGGPSKAVADGFYILTEPLPKGNHTVHFRSSLICSDPGCAEPNFAQDIMYTIIAK